MSVNESETFKPKEAQDNSEGKTLDNPELDRSKLLSERNDLDKEDETRTKVKKFTMGDGSFGIDMNDVKAQSGPALGKGIDASDEKAKAGDPPKGIETEQKTETGDGKVAASTIKRDDQDRPTEVTYPNGKSNKIEYDNNGNVKELQTAEGNTVKRDGDHWVVKEPDGKTREWKGDVSVTPEGDIIAAGQDQGTVIRHPDGSKTSIHQDGVRQETRDADGRLTSITYGDGKTNKIEYDDKGQVKTLKTAEGNTVEREGDHWKVTDPQGKTREWKGDVSVTDEGDIIAAGKDQGTVIRHPDGSKTNIHQDGVRQETRDIEGRVTSITYPDGKTNKVEYGEDGQVKSMKTAEGNTVEREGDHWKITEPGGKVREFKGKVKVDENGDVTVEREDGGGTIRRADGTKETFEPKKK